MQKHEFAGKLIYLRSYKDINQEELANRLKVSKRSVSAWETGEAFPRRTMRLKMAAAFDLSPDTFLLDEELSPNMHIDNAGSAEKELFDKLNYAIKSSGIEKQTQDLYFEAIYNAYNFKEEK